MTDKQLNGYVDRLRGNLELLDEQIENAREMSKPKKKEDRHVALQWAKTLRDLIELRNATLANVKAHLLGRDETGLPTEPEDYYEGNAQVSFERDFRTLFLAQWHESDLKLECEDCGVNSEKVVTRRFPGGYDEYDGFLDLCEKCYRQRTAKEKRESGGTEKEDSDSDGKDPLDGIDLSTLPPETAEAIRKLKETRDLVETEEADENEGAETQP